MRTTLAIDDSVLERAKALARSRRQPLGRVITELLRRGLELQMDERDGLPIFRVPSAARRITAESVRRAEDDW